MKLSEWVVDKKVYFMSQSLTLFLLMLLLSVLGLNISARIFVLIFMLLGHGIYLVYDWYRRYHFYKELKDNLKALDRKTLIAELVEKPNFYEGQLLHHTIQEISKCMNDEIGLHKKQWFDYRDYIETWVHEVKTPLAASNLIIQNNPSLVTRNLAEELNKVEAYVDQALYYARSNHVEKDYIIKSVDLDSLVKESIRKHSRMLIAKKCEISTQNLQVKVKTDQKWMVFILSQIIGNSIKYSKENMTLSFESVVYDNTVNLMIRDNGIGIEKDDLRNVFEKGFIGNNGRKHSKSTGIGLYLCKELAGKMGLSMQIQSEANLFTCVTISFPYLKIIDNG